MPPAISDDEMEDEIDDVDVPDEVPARKVTKAASSTTPAKKGRKPEAAEPEPEEEEEEDGDEDDEEGEDEYQVEKILAHDFSDKGVVLYRIMWLGYPKEEDYTWEPVENLSGAKEILSAYHKSIGGAPTQRKKGAAAGAKGAKNNKRAAPAAEAAEESPAPPAKKRGRKSNGAADTNGAAKSSSQLPLGLWEDDVQRVTAIIEDTEQGSTISKERDIKSLKGLLEWNGGRKTEHTMDVLRQKCPQRLLDYYEQHLEFGIDREHLT